MWMVGECYLLSVVSSSEDVVILVQRGERLLKLLDTLGSENYVESVSIS